MRNTNSYPWRGTVVGVALLTSLATMPALADTDAQTKEARISADVQAKSVTGQLSPEERQALSLAAGRVLKHVSEARQDIANKEKDKALAQLNKGMTLVQIIEKAVPDYQVTATIKSGDLVYHDEDTVKMLMVPIYMDLDQVSLLGPIKAAKKEALTKKIKGEENEVVKDVAFEDTSVWLDVALARRDLTAAITALKNDKFDAADERLTAIETTGVEFASVAVDLPLVQARENLTLAKTAVTENQLQEARRALQEASRDLQAYEKEAKETTTAQKAHTLRQEVDQLAQTIETDQTGAKDKITQWWDQLAKWVG